MTIKVTVVGGGSTYTPELVEGLAALPSSNPSYDNVIHDNVNTRR
jgi:alpha-galactosidase/6-phospho-beta-glucosidase family protein